MKRLRFPTLIVVVILIGLVMLSPLTMAICPAVAPAPAEAQDQSCPNVLLQALDFARQNCTALGRGRACYGNVDASAEPQNNTVQFRFTSPGDVVNVSDIKTIQLSAYNPTTNAWGIVLMRVQANLPNSAPGQNVLILMFGDVSVNDASGSVPGSTPMQAFVFRTAIDPPVCRRLPSSGIIVQAPAGAGKVEMVANGVTLSFASTVFLQSQPSGDMDVSTIEGNVSVEAQGYTVRVPAGSTVRIPMDQNSAPSGPPAPPAPYNLDLEPALQLQLLANSTNVSASNAHPNCRNS